MLERRNRRSRYAKPPDISGWVLLGGAAACVILLVLFTRNGCDNEFAALLRLRMVSVDTWAEWREHLAGTDLYLKYRAFTVTYEPDSIRTDFVEFLTINANANSPLTHLWNQGTALHVDSRSDQEFDEASAFFERLTRREWADLPQEEYYIHATIASLFQEVIIHGPGGRTSRISLPFLYGE